VLTLLPVIALPVALVLAGLALCSAHIPGLRRLTGAAPLTQEPDEAADFARTIHDGHTETPEQWAARIEAAEAPGEGS
jgi:hypothetical protein